MSEPALPKPPSPLQLRDELETLVLKELLGPGSAEEELIESPGTRYFVGVLAPRKRAKAGAAPAKAAVVPPAEDEEAEADDEIRQRQLTVIPTVSEREQAAARLAEQARRQRSLVEQIQQRLDDMGRERDGLIEHRRNLRNQHERIPAILAEIQDWNEVLEGRKPNTELQRLEQALSNNESEVTASRERLATLISAQVDRAMQFTARFDALVKKTLTNDFKGVVDIQEDGVNFRIVRGESLSGEAYETLAILLADLALLLESAAEHAHHPGLLIHDSPREADLNLRIYQKLLDVADEELRASTQQNILPYQYIVTTTTLPSKALRKKSITKVELGSGEASLFKMQLEKKKGDSEGPSLFDREGDA